MEARDLMIGDWVLDKAVSDNPVQIEQINEQNVHYKRGNGYMSVGVELLEPVPLMPEILEKNGFYYGYTSDEEDLASNTIAQLSEDDKGWCWDEGGGAIKVIFPNETDGGMLVIDDQSFDRHLELVYITTIYVHELQYVMRLCGIEKEIIL